MLFWKKAEFLPGNQNLPLKPEFLKERNQGETDFQIIDLIDTIVIAVGCTHLRATLILISVNLFFIVFAYFAVKISRGRNKKIGIVEKQPIRIPSYNSPEKVHAVLNYLSIPDR
jgi:hypothetical protein